jgi:hypothetical protein
MNHLPAIELEEHPQMDLEGSPVRTVSIYKKGSDLVRGNVRRHWKTGQFEAWVSWSAIGEVSVERAEEFAQQLAAVTARTQEVLARQTAALEAYHAKQKQNGESPPN